MNVPLSHFAELLLRAKVVSQQQLDDVMHSRLGSAQLGEALVQSGALSRKQLQQVVGNAIASGEVKMLERPPLGEVLLELGFVDTVSLNQAFAEQRQNGKRLGDVLMELELCTPEQVYEALGLQARLATHARAKEHAQVGNDSHIRRLVLVDDSAFSCALVKEALTLRGFEVHTCTDAREVLPLVESVKPSLVLTDLDMPHLDGNGLCQLLKQQVKHALPVIILTANDRDKERVTGLRSGADDYVHKGVSMNELAARIDSVLRRTDETARMRRLFARYTSDAVVEEVLRSGQVLLSGEKREVTVLFADVRNFTSIAESRPAEEVISLLNTVLGSLADVVLESNGTLDKFLGDGLMAVWGAPTNAPDAADLAVDAALKMLAVVKSLKASDTVELGIGINTGVVIAGGLGSARRTEYTCIGDAVNVAARLCAMAGPTEILLGETTQSQLRNSHPLTRLPPVRVKGRVGPVPLFSLKA
jgi:adenylate cyclase